MSPKKSPEGSALAPVMAVGTFVVDYHKVIDHFPRERMSAKVRREQVSHGGAPLNVLIALAKLGVSFPLHAGGKVGSDLDGRLIVDCCNDHGIDISQLQVVEGANTGYTDVFTVESTSRHTCFHYSGIGDTFARKDVKLRAVKPKILFLGSLGALGKMDNHNGDYGRKGATQLLRDATKQEITTLIEIAPTNGSGDLEDFKETIPFADYLVLNDRLAENMLGMEVSSEGLVDPELATKAAAKIFACGLRKAVVIQAGHAAVYVGADGTVVEQSRKRLPSKQRVGSAGVDHAFTAGFIEGLYHDKPVETCLQQGLAVAKACRRDLSPSGSIVALADCLRL